MSRKLKYLFKTRRFCCPRSYHTIKCIQTQQMGKQVSADERPQPFRVTWSWVRVCLHSLMYQQPVDHDLCSVTSRCACLCSFTSACSCVFTRSKSTFTPMKKYDTCVKDFDLMNKFEPQYSTDCNSKIYLQSTCTVYHNWILCKSSNSNSRYI